MEHKEAKSFFTCYYDGDLDEADKVRLESHLAECDSCQAEWEEYRKTMGEVSGLLAMAPPPDVVQSVERKINRRSRGRFFNRQKSPNIQFALVSFILVLLFMLAYLMLTAVNEIVLIDGDTAAQSSQEGSGSPDAQ